MDLLSIVLAATEHVAEEAHKSEMPFFLLGGALALFAIAISIVGFRKPDFPSSDSAAKGVMAVSVALVVGTMGAIIYVSG